MPESGKIPWSERAEMLLPPFPWDRHPHQRNGDGAGKVVLLHGLGRSWHSMNPLSAKLQKEGYATLNLPYPSLLKPVDWILDHVSDHVSRFAQGDEVHFVTHSLGGIVTRKLLARECGWTSGKLVMLAPPSSGSEIIDWGLGNPFFRHLLSPAARSLATPALSQSLPPLPENLSALVIMGSRSSIPFFRKLLGEMNDGIVSIERGKVSGAHFAMVEADHTFIQIHPDTVQRTISFLRGTISSAPLSGSVSS